MEKTDDQRWPGLVNSDRNLGGLFLEHLDQALWSHGQLRDVEEHRFQDSDLYKIVLGATLKVNPFNRPEFVGSVVLVIEFAFHWNISLKTVSQFPTPRPVWRAQGDDGDKLEFDRSYSPIVLGNERVISTWPARGCLVIVDGIVYFGAGIWPMHGTFLYALQADTGEVVWARIRATAPSGQLNRTVAPMRSLPWRRRGTGRPAETPAGRPSGRHLDIRRLEGPSKPFLERRILPARRHRPAQAMSGRIR